jgi:hypothetical protein
VHVIGASRPSYGDSHRDGHSYRGRCANHSDGDCHRCADHANHYRADLYDDPVDTRRSPRGF